MKEMYDLEVTFMDDQTITVPKITRHFVEEGKTEGILHCIVEYNGKRDYISSFPVRNIRRYRKAK